MSKYEILVDKINNSLHVALLKNGKLDDLYMDIQTKSPRWAEIYLGKVVKIDKILNAAFIDLGDDKYGYLPVKHAYIQGIKRQKNTLISQLLKTGDMIIVQVKSEMTRGGYEEHEKLPRLTMKLQLFGRTLNYSPNVKKLLHAPRLSKSDLAGVTSELKSLDGGWFIRDSINNFKDEETLAEAAKLHKLWTGLKILVDDSKTGAKPKLIFKGPDATRRALIDYAAHEIEMIEIADDFAYENAIKWCERYAPDLSVKIIQPRLDSYKEKQNFDLFEFRDITAAIEELDNSNVPLKSGGSIIIECTRAMTVIDVNLGSGSDVIKANTEAAIEIARQIRLRNICGMIVVDFISMQHKNDRHSILKKLEQESESDPANPQLHGFTRLSNFEITRRRRTHSLKEKNHSLTVEYSYVTANSK